MIEGHLHPDFWPVARRLRKQLGHPPRGGAAVCVYHRGEKVVDIWGGIRDATGRPWRADTMSISFSTTKGVTATVLHLLVDRGLLDYDAPVAKYWPEFAQNGKECITVRHLLCHEAGLYRIRNLIDHAKRMCDWECMIAALARSTPAHEPGAANGYHGLTFGWLIGELIQRVTGKQLSEVLQTELAEPLKLDALYIGAPVNQLHRASELMPPSRTLRPGRMKPIAKRVQGICSALRLPVDVRRMADALMPVGIEEIDPSSPEILAASIPSANGLFTARSLAKLYAALAAGGQLDGVRLLSEDTVRRATQVQNRRVDLVVPFPMHWRLGYHRAATTRGTPRHAFGHYGFGGSGAWADPDRNLAMAMVLNHRIYTPLGNLRTARMGAIVLRCADRR
jgi:CubicO group peptidase (beta-lactamase class C family)